MKIDVASVLRTCALASKQADVLSKILTGLSISNRSSPGVPAMLF